MLRSLINQRLGRYYIKELLGRGGMAAVYRALDTLLERDVALKVLYPQFSDDEDLVRRFQREAVTAAALEHPHIVPVYDVDEQDGMAFIAMKLLTGHSLQERLQAVGAIPLSELLQLLAPVAAALDYAHRKGVVHRDIKPGNIFLNTTPDGERVMLTDFGIAKQLDTPGLTTTGAIIGTPDYMAPEQIAGRPVDGRTDVYALGMLVYRALTGRRAFEGTTQDVLLGHLYQRPTPASQLNSAIPAAVDPILERATAAAPADRFPTAGAFLDALAGAAHAPAERTAVGLPPALVAPAAVAAPPRRPVAPPVAQSTARASAPETRRPAATSATVGAATLPGPAPQAAGNTLPWLAAVLLALVAGGLAVALFLTLSRAGAMGTAPSVVVPPLVESPSPTLPPPTETLPPPSSTPEPTPSEAATLTPEPTAPAADPSAVTPPAATPRPSATTRPSATATVPPSPTPTATEPATPTATVTEPPTATATEPATPTATVAEPPTATATQQPQARCNQELLAGGFGRLWSDNIGVRTDVGCPLEREVTGEGSEQFFARGTMFYWSVSNNTPNADYIYVFYDPDNGEYEAWTPTEVAALGPDPTPGPDPNQPLRGFGRIYANKSSVREALGAPTSPEFELEGARLAVMQRFENALMIFTPFYQPTGGKSIFVLYNDGRFDRFDDSLGG